MSESKFIIIKRDGESFGKSLKYVRHEGHQHFWTKQRTEAMEYTKIDVAQALASKMKGEVKAI